MDTEQTRELSIRLSKAWAAADVDTISTLLAEDVVHETPEGLDIGAVQGQAEVAGYLAGEPLKPRLDVDTIQREVVLEVVDGMYSLLGARLSARTSADAPYANTSMLLCAWQDGQLVRIDEFSDSLALVVSGLVTALPTWHGSRM